MALPPRPASPVARITNALGRHSKIVVDGVKAVVDNRRELSLLKMLWKKLLKE